jgi:Ni/Co efflux regulator RcnB
MKALFIGALSLGLIVATGAWAEQEHHNNNGGNHGGGGSHETHGSSGGNHMGGHESSGGSVHHSGSGHITEHRNVDVHHNVDVHRHVDVHHNVDVHHGVNIHGGRVGIHGGARLSHFHVGFRAPHRFHARAWFAPRGFHYRRFSIGERIPSILLAADFFIADYAAYDLEYPGDDYVWVRDGDDAVLVDRYSGEVIEVEYDVFY